MCVDFLCQCSMYDKIIQYMQRYLIPYFLQCFDAVGSTWLGDKGIQAI